MKLRQHTIDINLPYNLKENLNFELTEDEINDNVQGFHFTINSKINEKITCIIELEKNIDLFYSFDLINEFYIDLSSVKFFIEGGRKIEFYLFYKDDCNFIKDVTKFIIKNFEIITLQKKELNSLLIDDNLIKNNNFNIIFQFSPKYHFDIYRYHLILYLSNFDDKEGVITSIFMNANNERQLESDYINFLISVHKNIIAESKDILVFTDYKDEILKLIKKIISVKNEVGTSRKSVILSSRESLNIKSSNNEIFDETFLKINKLKINNNNKEEDKINTNTKKNRKKKVEENKLITNLNENIEKLNIYGANYVKYKIFTNRLISKPYFSIILHSTENNYRKILDSFKNILRVDYNYYFEIITFNIDINIIQLLKKNIRSLFSLNKYLMQIVFVYPNKKLFKLSRKEYSLLQEIIILSYVSVSASGYIFLYHANSIWNRFYIEKCLKKIENDREKNVHIYLSSNAMTYFPLNGKIDNYHIEKNKLYEKYQQCIFPIINKDVLNGFDPNFYLFSKINKIKDIKLIMCSMPNINIKYIDYLKKNSENKSELHIFEN